MKTYLKYGTPLLDIKSYITDFDAAKKEKIGWLESLDL